MSVLITGGNSRSRLTKAKEIFPDGLIVNPTGVGEIRELEGLISTGQSVIVENAQNLTEEAQNAFLKTLEEPPAGTEIILLAENEDQLLLTVTSRCLIINISTDRRAGKISNQEKQILDWIESYNFGNGSKWAETVKNRGEAIALIDTLIVASGTKHLRQLLKAKKYLQANTNVRLTLENLFLK
ncbi:hypothetical protein M1403_00320 [Patescibacteria group bacterium]|nr:hypothetical protein [Patescibacteria group bacterium]